MGNSESSEYIKIKIYKDAIVVVEMIVQVVVAAGFQVLRLIGVLIQLHLIMAEVIIVELVKVQVIL